MIVRHPFLDEVDSIVALFADEVRAGRMLPRTIDEIRANLHDWLVAEKDGRIVGCVSLVYFNGTLSEIRSLAVDESARGNGVATGLIKAAVTLAHERGRLRVLTLTRAVHLFEQCGFQQETVANFPDKVWKDCALCPFRHACDEVALVYHLS